VKTQSQPIRLQLKPFALARYFLYCVLVAFSLGPLFWLITISLKTRQEFGAEPFSLPDRIQFHNFIRIVGDSQMTGFMANSVMITSISLIILLGTSIPAAYAIARMDFKGRNFLYVLFLMGDMVPIIMIIIPLFMLNRLLGINSTRWALILPYVAGSMGFSVFILRGFLRTLSSELEDAARIDGCNTLQLIWYIVLPLIRPGAIVVAIMTFIFFWNEYFLASVLLPKQEMFTLPAGIASAFFGRFRQDWPAASAGALLSIIPVIMIFIFAQEKIIEGWKTH